MSTIQQEAAVFSRAATSLQRQLASFMHMEGLNLRTAFAERSPVYYGRFKQSWRISKSPTQAALAGFTIFNPISYGRFIEYGVDPGSKHVWARHFSSARAKKSSSRLANVGGRIWSKKAIGGVIGPIVTPAYTKDLAQRVADRAIMVIK